jgi:hypothetical protein
MVEVGIAISVATSAFNGIKKAMAAGKEIEDCASYFGKFFDAKDQISEASVLSENAPLAAKMFAGTSVEAQALEITAAKHKAEQLEKELREFLIYTGQGAFYQDMMRERRRIRRARYIEAQRKAANKKFWTDVIILGGLVALCLVGLVTCISLAVASSSTIIKP